LENHRYQDKFASTKSGNKGRLTAIGREIANMTTSLPAGIFVRVAESRCDIAKILIVGVEGTPYEGGLFTFDLFLDSDYPNSPPKLTFTLDGNDSEGWSFNPNLHLGSGTVCLSIINTWSGLPAEMWQPGKSTILAVLISIQAMILGAPLPWINEPGYSQQHKTPEAQAHKLLVQYKTVRYAMLKWLGPTLDAQKSIWNDVRQVYWQHNALSTFLTVKEWAKTNHMISEVPGFVAKSNKKARGRVHTPAVPDGDLVEKLATLLKLTEHLDAKPLKVEGPESSTKPSTRSSEKEKKKEKGKRKHVELSDGSETDDSMNYYYDEAEDGFLPVPIPKPPVKPPAKKQKSAAPKSKPAPKKSKGKGKAKAQKEPETRWVYTGAHTQKESRDACKEFELSGCKSIKDTIAKLEAFVNDEGLGENDAAQRWGILEATE
jgi:ubiquitin-protein ligase